MRVSAPLIMVSYLSRRRHLETNAPLSLTDFQPDSQPSRGLRLEQQEDRVSAFETTLVQHHEDGSAEPLIKSKYQKPALGAKDQRLKVRLLDFGERILEKQTQIQVISVSQS